MNINYSTYIRLDVVYLTNILSVIHEIVAEVLFDIDFEKKETVIYSVSDNNEGMGLKLFIVLKNVTYINEDKSIKNILFIVDTSSFLSTMKTFTKLSMIMIIDQPDHIYLESKSVSFIKYDKEEIAATHRATNTCKKVTSELNHKFDISIYPINNDTKYYAQFLLYDLDVLRAFMKNADISESMKMQFNKNGALLYINNTKNSPTLEARTRPEDSNIETPVIKTISLSNIFKLCTLKKISKYLSIKAHKINPENDNAFSMHEEFSNKQINNDKVFDIDALVIHPLVSHSLHSSSDYDLTFIINCNSFN